MTLALWTPFGQAAAIDPAANRFVFVILRGVMDGLPAVPAIGDPSFAQARGALADFSAMSAEPRRRRRDRPGAQGRRVPAARVANRGA